MIVWKSCVQCIFDHWHHIKSLFLFFLFCYFHKTKKKEFVADLVLHLQCIDIQKSTLTTTCSHTYVQHYQRGARQTIQTRKKHVKKRTNKTTNICPAEASTNGKGTDTQYKNITILYIKWPLLALAQDYTHIKKRWPIGFLLFFSSTFFPFIFDYHLQSQLSNAQCTAAYDLFSVVHT